MKKNVLIGFLLVIMLIAACTAVEPVPEKKPAPAPAPAPGEVGAAEYIGSESCQACHPDYYEGWKGTQHPYMIQKSSEILPEAAAALQEALDSGNEDFLRIGSDGEEFITSIDQIDYVNGVFFKQRFVVNTDQGHRFLTAQYNVPSGELTQYLSSSNWEDNCLGCHSTGLDLDKVNKLDRSAAGYRLEDNFVEFGIGCETCHGPGSEHIANPMDKDLIINPADFTIEEQTHFCGSCHGRASGHVELSRNDPIGFQIGDNIFDYTKVLSPGTNQNVWVDEEGYWDREEGGSRRFHPDGGAISHRMQFNDMIQGPHYGEISCTACHDMHAAEQIHTSTGAPSTLRWEFSESCSACHGDKYDPEEYMPVRANNSNVQDQRNHTFLPGGVGNPDPDVPERK